MEYYFRHFKDKKEFRDVMKRNDRFGRYLKSGKITPKYVDQGKVAKLKITVHPEKLSPLELKAFNDNPREFISSCTPSY